MAEACGQIVHAEKMGIFLAQYMGQPGCSNVFEASETMSDMGYHWVQLPPDVTGFDLDLAAKSKGYAQDFQGSLREKSGVGISEISFHLPGQLVMVNPSQAELFAGFLPADLRQGATLDTMYRWGAETTGKVIEATHNLGLTAAVGFTGASLFPVSLYPWPPRPPGLVEEAMKQLAIRWAPIIRKAYWLGVKLAFELHPGEDVFDGYTFELFRDALKKYGKLTDDELTACCINYDPSHFILQQLDYLEFIRIYGELIAAYHGKDGEFIMNGRIGAYGGFAPWSERPGKFRTPGLGQIKFAEAQPLLVAAGYDGVVVVEWEDVLQAALQGAAFAFEYFTTGAVPDAEVIPADTSFEDFAKTGDSTALLLRVLGYNQFSIAA